MTASPLDRILDSLDRVTERGEHWEARCPAHDDRVASLSLSIGAEGRCLIKCHAGCAADAILEALGLTWKDLFVDTDEPASSNDYRRIVSTYDYTDAAGELLYQVVRYTPKGFAQRRPDGAGVWKWNLQGATRVPYRLPELIQAVADGRWIFIVEGEKDVETLRELGFAATTSAGGAQSWDAAFGKHFVGARVAILPDNDTPGRDYARTIADVLAPLALDVRVVTLPGLADHGDVTDWVVAGGLAEQLRNLVRAAAGSTRRELLKQWRESQGGAVITWAADVTPTRVRWLWPGRIPYGKLTILDGDPGESKSTLTLALASLASRGAPMPLSGMSGPQAPITTILLSAEDGMDDTITPRLLAHGADTTRVAHLDAIRLPDAPERPWELPGDIQHLSDLIEELDAKLVVIDPLMAFLGGDVKSGIDHDVRRALHPLAQAAERTGAAIVVVRHLNKGSGAAIGRGGGSMGIIGAARSGLLIAHDPNDETRGRRVVAGTKNNLMEMPQSIQYHLAYNAEYDCATVVWDGYSHHTCDTLLVQLDPDDVAETGRCAEILKQMLAEEQLPLPVILKRMRALAINDKILAKARRMLNLYEVTTGDSVYWGLEEGVRRVQSQSDGDGVGNRVRPLPSGARDPSEPNRLFEPTW